MRSPMREVRFRSTAALVGLLSLVVACTGTPPGAVDSAVIAESPGDVAAEGSPDPDDPSETGGEPVALGSEEDRVGTTVTSQGADTTGGSADGGTTGGTADGGTATGGAADGGTTTGGSTDGGGTDGGSATGGTADGGASDGGSSDGGSGGGQQPEGPPEAQLYDDQAKYVGITDDRIHLCGHAALIFADAFDTRPEDLNVYWEAVNANGGVHGRKVTVSWKDDAYNSSQAVQAAESCKSEKPFFTMGGIGFDQIPAVREWSEQNRMLYLHHIAVAPTKTYNFSYSAQPTVNAVGTAFGEYIARAYGDEAIGIIWRDSENWQPGHENGRAYMNDNGVDVVADERVTSDQQVFSQEIAAMQSAGAEVVWVWENALKAAQIIQQASSQGYRPKWVVFPFQTTLDVIGGQALNPSMDGVASWPAYTQGGYSGRYAWTDHGYQQEIERFEATHAEYRDSRPNDILWQVWVSNKFLHEMLLLCGPDCNRNRVAGLMLSGWKTTVQPNCTTDFAHPNSYGNHIGGHRFYTQQTFDRGGGDPAWRTTGWCAEHLD